MFVNRFPPLASRSFILQVRLSSTNQNTFNLKNYQEKYRTSCSDILATVPHGCKVTEETQNKLVHLFSEYYERVGVHATNDFKHQKNHSSKLYEEAYNYYHSKLADYDDPFYALTNFPLLTDLSGNKVVTEESFTNQCAEFFQIPSDERQEFDNLIKHGELLPNDEWVLNFQDEMHKEFDEIEDKQQDIIDTIDWDFGAGNHNCDYRALSGLFEGYTNPELLELEKEYLMTPEEIEEFNYLEAVRNELKDDPFEQYPVLPDIDG